MKYAIKDILQNKFNHSSFRIGQEEAIQSILAGNDSLVMLPTGVGKSLCYQLPAYLLDGTVLVVSPLLSLMQDQVESLKAMGEKQVVALNSESSFAERENIFQKINQYRFIYTSPEMLQNPRVIAALKSIKISIFVVDEAHCISHWGTDFRPDYLVLADVRRQLGEPRTMALTATATKEVRDEIIQFLSLDEDSTHQIVQSVDRPEIKFIVEHSHGDKDQRLKNYLEKLNGPGIVYFMSKKLADQWASRMNEEMGISAASYHSDIEADDKSKIQQQFLKNELDVICATSAFGMGFDKKDIRFVIHYHLPASAEMYLQEVGRASRDGKDSLAILLYQPGDEQIQWRFIENSLPDQFLLEKVAAKEKISANVEEALIKLANYYLGISSSLGAAGNLIAKRRKMKEKQLYFMLDYIHTKNCKRSKLLGYFDEEKTDDLEICCSSCHFEQEYFIERMNRINSERVENKKIEKIKSWKAIFDSFYNKS